jgi:hypothetical protein
MHHRISKQERQKKIGLIELYALIYDPPPLLIGVLNLLAVSIFANVVYPK